MTPSKEQLVIASELRIEATRCRDAGYGALATRLAALAGRIESSGTAPSAEGREAVAHVATLHDDGHWTWNGVEPFAARYAGWRMKVYAAPQPPAAEAKEAVAAIAVSDMVEHCHPLYGQGFFASEDCIKTMFASPPPPVDEAKDASAIGAWLSAALDDPKACAEFKRDIENWFAAREPAHAPYLTAAHALCSDLGIPEGEIGERIGKAREEVQAIITAVRAHAARMNEIAAAAPECKP